MIKKSLYLGAIVAELVFSTAVSAKDINIKDISIDDIKPIKMCKLNIVKSTKVNTFTFGDTGKYFIDVKNIGKQNCYGRIVVKDKLPQGMSIDMTSVSSGWDCDADRGNPQTVTCQYTRFSLSPGQSASRLFFDVRVPIEEQAHGYGWFRVRPVGYTHIARNCAIVRNIIRPIGTSIAREQVESDCTNVSVKEPKLKLCEVSIEKTTKEKSFIFGEGGTYILNVKNRGNNDCYNVVASDTLPQGMRIDMSSVSDGWDCDADNQNPQTVRCYANENPLLAHTTAPILTFKVDVPTQEESGGQGWINANTAKNCATIRGRESNAQNYNQNIDRNMARSCVDTTVLSQTAERPFKIKVDTTIPSHNHSNTQFQIPTNYDEYTYDYNVDCDSDGINEAEGVSGNYTCHYATPGIYTISISGTFPQIEFMPNCEHTRPDYYRVVSLEQWGTIKWKSMKYAFISTKNMVGNAIDTPDLSSVENMTWMFRNSNFNQDISNWDVSNVKNMNGVFFKSNFNENLSNWDVSSVTNMGSMFYYTNFNQDISNWDVSSVKNMGGMFSRSPFNQDISNWNVSNVTNMMAMFSRNEVFNQDISHWNVSNVTDMSQLFREGIFNQDISHWNVSNVTNMSAMFFKSQFNQDISHWTVSNVTNMSHMFNRNEAFNQDISNWNVSNVTNMSYMFYRAHGFSDNDLSVWDVHNVENYYGFSYGWGIGNTEPSW